MLIGPDSGPRQIIGIETKYHEHSVREPSPKPEQVERHYQQDQRFIEISQRSGVFIDGWQGAVRDTDLRQIWRDHLLVLSMLEHPARWSGGRNVLAYPARNCSFADVARRYSQLLAEADTTFLALTIEELTEAVPLHDPGTSTAFKDRYLW